VRLDQPQDTCHNPRIEGLVKPCSTREVPGVDYEVDQTEPQVGSSGDVAVRAWNRPRRRCRGERVRLASCRVGDGRSRIVPDLITCEQCPCFIAIDARQQ